MFPVGKRRTILKTVLQTLAAVLGAWDEGREQWFRAWAR